MKSCPRCGYRPVKEPPRRLITCRWCGEVVQQIGMGRAWVTCRAPVCLARQRHYRREGGATLERMEG